MAISIARALVEAGRFVDEFKAYLAGTAFTTVFKNGKDVYNGRPEKECQSELRANLQSMNDRLETQFVRWCNINRKNNETVITIDGRDLTIAEALIYRNKIIPLKKEAVARLKSQYATAHSKFTGLAVEADAQISKLGVGATEETIRVIRENFDPSIVDMKPHIDKIEAEIQFYERELDSLLTEKNPTTLID